MAGDMATPKPGEIRCPTCHRSTPPATFCTQCGSPIPSDARARPRGLDRDELQDRIRARRSGDPFRRGTPVEGWSAPGYETYEPRPEDATARRGSRSPMEQRIDRFGEARREGGPQPVLPPPDVTREPEPDRYERWHDPRSDPMEGQPYDTPAPAPVGAVPPQAEPTYVDNFDEEAAYAYDDGYGEVDYRRWEEPRRGGAGGAGLAILGVLALGVLALMGGVVLAGVFDGDGVAEATPTPTVSEAAIETATPAPSLTPTAPVSAAPSGSPAASGGPVVFPDGFVARAQPCLPGSASTQGCNSNGSTNSGTVDIWVGFEKGTAQDVIGAELIGPEGNVLSDGSIDLARIGCSRTCNGWTRFNFGGLEAGTYEVRISRNGEFAGSTTFEVT